jgi:hypothetical protein
LTFGCASAQPRFFEGAEEPTTVTDGEQAPPVEAEAEEEEEEDEEEDVEEPDVKLEEQDLEGWIEEEEDDDEEEEEL